MKNTIFVLFCVGVLSIVAPSGVFGFPSQVTVDARQNCTTTGCAGYTAGSRYYFEPGVYRITPLSGAAFFGGTWGWIWTMYMYIENSGQCPGILCGPTPYPPTFFQTAQEALAACNEQRGEIAIFTLCDPSYVDFFFPNTNCPDNSGTMTAQVERLVAFSLIGWDNFLCWR